MVIPLDKFDRTISQQNALLGSINDEMMIANFHNREIVKDLEWNRVFR